MHVQHLTSVDGEIVFDVDPDVAAPAQAGVRLADDLTVDAGAALAAARSAMLALFEVRSPGASVGVRPRLLTPRGDTVADLVAELRPLVESGTIGVSADFGIDETELVHLRQHGPVRGEPDVLEPAAGIAAAAAAHAWLGSLEGRTVAVEGFGATGGSIARELQRRGARLVAVSSERGAVADSAGLDPDELAAARAEHGDRFVLHLDRSVHAASEMYGLPVDILVPGPAFAALDGAVAATVQAPLVVPSGLGVYGTGGLDTLRAQRVTALPDIVTASGSALAQAAPQGLSAGEVLARVERLVSERVEAARLSKMDPVVYAYTLADTFSSTWIGTDG